MISDDRLCTLIDWAKDMADRSRHAGLVRNLRDCREALLELAGDRAALEYMRQFERERLNGSKMQ